MGKYEIVVIGCSAGGLGALEKILSSLDRKLEIPIAIVQHMSPDSGDSVLKLLDRYSKIDVCEPLDKDLIVGPRIYLAPAGYHLMVESDKSFSINMGPKENYSRPSIDVLFDTAAEVYQEKVLGIILTGANRDGTRGIKAIKEFGGTTIAQDPKEAQIATMPKSAIDSGCVDYILNLNEIGRFINNVLKE